MRLPPIPHRPLRIGVEHNPPVQIRTATGFAGLAVETVNEAARRAGVQLQWIETGTSSDEAFRRGLVDLWPLMADLPERRKRVHITRPWLHSSHALLLRTGSIVPGRGFSGRIALFKMPLHVRLLRTEFPEAQLIELPESQAVVKEVCKGTVSAGFLEGRAALNALRDKPPECASVALRTQILPDLTIQLGLASTFEAAGAAEKLRDEIGNLFRDGTLAVTMAKYSFYGLNDTWATYDLMASAERARWMGWGISALALALALTLWQARSLRRAKQAAEQANAATSQALSRYQLVSRAAHGAMFECDLESGKVTWNEAVHLMFGYAPDAVGSDMCWWEDRIHPADRERVSARMNTAINQGAPTWSDEYRFRRGDGAYAVVADRGHLLYDGGKAVRVVRAVMDVTAQRALEEQLREAQKMEAIGRLAGGIAHDFNNLLTVILGYNNLLEAACQPGDKAERHIHEIRQAADQAARLTQQLLAFSRRQVLRPEILDLNAVITDMARILRRVIGEDTELTVALAPDLGPVQADRGQIEQVVMNLCVNARDAMPRGGKLTLETANADLKEEDASRYPDLNPGPFVLLAVADTGCGMDAETQARIFEPFFTTKEVGKGTGLGLSTSHGIVKQSGGSISVHSEPGKGSTFRVFLPRVMDPAAPHTTASETNPDTAPPTETILVVEDEAAVRKLTIMLLQKRGYTVLSASDGEEAMRLLDQRGLKVDLLLTDVVMQRMGGCELARQLTLRHPAVKVLYMSGYAESAALGLALEKGLPLLAKPFTPTALLERVSQALYGAADGALSRKRVLRGQ